MNKINYLLLKFQIMVKLLNISFNILNFYINLYI